MSKLSLSFRQKNRTSKSFREQYAGLPESVQALTRVACELFDRDPSHRSLRFHELEERKRSSAVPRSFSVSISMQYRAIFFVVDGINVWYWIGTHAECDQYTGKK